MTEPIEQDETVDPAPLEDDQSEAAEAEDPADDDDDDGGDREFDPERRDTGDADDPPPQA